VLGFAAGLHAQTPIVAPVDRLAFDRPEAWALKYFTATTLLNGLQVPEAVPAGSIDLGFELAWLPTLSTSQQRVGFNGTKQEDLNKAPISGRPRVRIGLPGHSTLLLAFTLPVETFGITPRLIAIGVERPLVRIGSWQLGWRAQGQLGTATGAYTCPTRVLAFAPGSPGNPYGCQAESSDVATLRYIGGELAAARPLAGVRVTPHAGVTVTYVDTAFQVKARTFDYLDRTRLEAAGMILSTNVGVTCPVTTRLSVAADVFYAPLSVRRAFDGPATIEGLLNVRTLITYRVH
jgi:hypothetical protein